MPSSGVVTYTVNELEVIKDALEEIQVLGIGRTPGAEMIALGRRKLNLITKQWAGSTDYARGFKMWTRKRAFVFLQKNQHVYSLGPSGDHAAADSYATTTLSAVANATDTTITVASASAFASGNFLGIELDSGSIYWTAVDGAPVGSVVTLDAAMPSPASSGNRVFGYAAKMRRPLEILTAMLRDGSDDETPVDIGLTLQEYESIPNKTTDGTPDRAYYESQLTNGKLYTNREPDDVSKVVSLVYLSPPEDFTAMTDTVDFPQVWFRALFLQLAIDMAGSYGFPVTAELKGRRDEAVQIAQHADPETSTAFYQPNEDGHA